SRRLAWRDWDSLGSARWAALSRSGCSTPATPCTAGTGRGRRRSGSLSRACSSPTRHAMPPNRRRWSSRWSPTRRRSRRSREEQRARARQLRLRHRLRRPGRDGRREGLRRLMATQTKLPVERELALEMAERMLRIRAFETQANQLYLSAKMPGLTHLYVGEEAVAVGVCSALRRDDTITSTHRGHGHCIAKGADVRLMYCELLGREA